METQDLARRTIRGLHRRELLQACLAAAGVMSTWSLSTPSPLWGGRTGTAQARWHPAGAGAPTPAL